MADSPPPPPRPSQRVHSSASPRRVSSVPPVASGTSFRYSAPPEGRVPSMPLPRPPAAPRVPSKSPAPRVSKTDGEAMNAKGKGKQIEAVASSNKDQMPASTSASPNKPKPAVVGSVSPSKPKAPAVAASLLRRMAGPSDQKAGLLRDKEEVKAIIYEASKGSKYFQAQEAKDAELTVRVNKLIAHLDYLLAKQGHNVSKEERAVDEMLVEMEKARVLSETIVVVDADAFYAACHEREDPSLKGVAFGVGGGVLTTASYEARKYGCSSAMAGFVAKKLCPHLKFVKLDFALYSSCSKAIMKVLGEYGEISPASLDEAYCSLTDYCKRENVSPAVAAERMRAQVLAETGLTVSAGVSPNAMLSKVAADKNKPNGQCVIAPTAEACKEFAGSLPIRKIPGVGRVTERILQAVGVHTVADVYTLRGKLFLIRNQVGLTFLLRAYLGLGRTKIAHGDRSQRKGISVERTFNPDDNVEAFYKRLLNISEALAGDCDKSQYSGRTITLKIKTHTYVSLSRAKTLGAAIYFNDAKTFYAEGKKLLDAEMASRRAVIAKGGTPKGGKEFRLRLIGLRLSNLRDDKNVKGSGQLDGWAGTKSKSKTKVKKSKSKSKILPAKSEGSAPPPDLKHSSEEPLNGDMEEDNFDDEDGEQLSRSFDDYGDDDKPTVNGRTDARANQPASSDPLWAAVGDDDVSFDFADEDTPIDTTYKPFFTGGPSLNSKRHMGDGPTPMEDRLSFESKKRSTDDDDIIFVDDEAPSGPLECPVCSRSFIGSTVALSAHVASHFDDEPEPVKKKVKVASSSSKPVASSSKSSSSKANSKGQARSVKDMFSKR